MKKITVLLLFLVLACSNDDDSNNDCYTYTAIVETECGNTDTQTTYTISEQEYNYLSNQFNNANDPCLSVHFQDVNGNDVQAILRSVGKVNCP